jgi:hypothetical protein
MDKNWCQELTREIERDAGQFFGSSIILLMPPMVS